MQRRHAYCPEAYMDVDLYNEVMFEVHHCPYSMRSVLLKP